MDRYHNTEIKTEEIYIENIKTEQNEIESTADYSTLAKNAQCFQCNKTFSRARDLKRHINTVHEGLKPHKCNICGKAYNDLKRHINSVHDGLKQHTFLCFCGEGFSEARDLKRHINSIHEGFNSLKTYSKQIS